jgi:hypothetical protein
MRESSWTKLQHYEHTFDFEAFSTFNPPRKSEHLVPPPWFYGTVERSSRADVLRAMTIAARKVA